MPEPTNEKKSALPPGMVMGPDGKPCKVCNAGFRNWNPLKDPAAKAKANANAKGSTASAGALAGAGTASAINIQTTQPSRPVNCPPDREDLGRATWTFLHTTAAYFPERPTPSQRATMLGLLRALPTLYPCSHCASHLGEEMKTRPPDVSGRAGLSRWLCEVHNEVNERLGKPSFDCSLKSTDERWKDGPSDGSCD